MNIAKFGFLKLGKNNESELQLPVEQRVVRSQWGLAKGKVKLIQHQKVVENYEEGFNVIREHTGFGDISKFVESFLERENKIYALMKNAQDRDEQLGFLEKELEAAVLEVEKFKGKEESSAEAQQSKHKQLQGQFEALEQQHHFYMAEIERKKILLRNTRNPTKAILERLNCTVEEMHLDDDRSNEVNVQLAY